VIAIAIYSRPGCHLCEEMKAVVQKVARREHASVTIDEIDISTDPSLESRYGLEIPVLMVDGKKTAKYRVTEDEVTRMLRAR
jgi:glutaredoxin